MSRVDASGEVRGESSRLEALSFCASRRSGQGQCTRYIADTSCSLIRCGKKNTTTRRKQGLEGKPELSEDREHPSRKRKGEGQSVMDSLNLSPAGRGYSCDTQSLPAPGRRPPNALPGRLSQFPPHRVIRVEIPGDRSFTYGFFLRLAAMCPQSLGSLVIFQTLAGILSRLGLAFILRRFFRVRAWLILVFVGL